MARWLATLALFVANSAHAGALSPCGLQTAPGETWLTPYLFVDSDRISNHTYLAVGLGQRVDIIGGVGVSYAGGLEAGVVEAMPRLFLHDSVGVVLRFGSVPGTMHMEIGPEVHAAWRAGRFGFATNVGWRPVVGPASGVGSAFGVFAPEMFLTDRFSVFAEIDPSVDLASGSLDLAVVPGFSFAAGEHGFALGTVLPTNALGDWTVGGWYSVRLGSIR